MAACARVRVTYTEGDLERQRVAALEHASHLAGLDTQVVVLDASREAHALHFLLLLHRHLPLLRTPPLRLRLAHAPLLPVPVHGLAHHRLVHVAELHQVQPALLAVSHGAGLRHHTHLLAGRVQQAHRLSHHLVVEPREAGQLAALGSHRPPLPGGALPRQGCAVHEERRRRCKAAWRRGWLRDAPGRRCHAIKGHSQHRKDRPLCRHAKRTRGCDARPQEHGGDRWGGSQARGCAGARRPHLSQALPRSGAVSSSGRPSAASSQTNTRTVAVGVRAHGVA